MKAAAYLQVTGFRDPYVLEVGGNGRDWRIVIGSGIAGEGGALLVYASKELTSGTWSMHLRQCRLMVSVPVPGGTYGVLNSFAGTGHHCISKETCNGGC